MNQPDKRFTVQSSAVSDRGLNERRPLNEDSFLADSSRGVFAVADGVGGAEAGEVASQTAVEVLDEAFRHQVDGADIEDLMELAIQRANASIHQMAQDHAKFSMMATTIVALHLDGRTATIGHVGDSRLYRLTPDGQLLRETEDHSVVEEEVRAGRMTPEQAANHPSKNVISRALGAENDVEVDMKTIEVDEGTEFLLCSDGITRHVPDYEMRQLLIVNEDLAAVCDELKRRCYERGAEDNLTAVIVRVGRAIPAEQRAEELERTVSPDVDPLHKTIDSNVVDASQTVLIPASRVAFPAPETAPLSESSSSTPLNVAPPATTESRRGFGGVLLLLLALAAIAAAFYGGRVYKGPVPFLKSNAEPTPSPVVAAPVVVEDPFAKFERSRREVDSDPAAWLLKVPTQLTTQNVQTALESNDPQFLYLYGRASMLTGNSDDAAKAFSAAIAKANASPSAENATISKEATIALAAVTLKLQKGRPQAILNYDEMLKRPASTSSPQ